MGRKDTIRYEKKWLEHISQDTLTVSLDMRVCVKLTVVRARTCA